ncbi:MAG: hypothetical protein LAP87_16200 [Acidobacteriia bacterium]|nr:hypothetical protein [Terriglobia bacterium]
MFQVVNRCFQIIESRAEDSWRRHSDLVMEPDVRGIGWDGFTCGPELLKAGEAAALAALPQIEAWLARPRPPALLAAVLPETIPAGRPPVAAESPATA